MRYPLHFRSALLGLALCLLANIAGALPNLITYQGRLTNPQGQPITTQVTVTFTFWDSPSGGNRLGTFTDSKAVLPNKEGVYTTLIGTEYTNTIPTTIFEQDRVFLNVNVNGEDLLPRPRITASAAAIGSDRVQTYTAGEDIKAGTVVMATSDGKIRKAHDPGTWTTYETSYVYMYRISSTQLLALSTYNQVQKLFIMTVNPDGTFTTTPLSFDQGQISNIITLGGGQFVFEYSGSGGNGILTAGTVSGSNITYGSPFILGGEKVFYAGGNKIISTTSNSSLSASTTAIKLATVQGNTITLKDSKTLTGVYFEAGCPLTTDKCLVIGVHDTASYTPTLCMVGFSGDTLQFGSPITVGTNNQGPRDLFQVDDGKAVMFDTSNSCAVVTANGLTPVIGTKASVMYSFNTIVSYPVASNTLYLLRDDNTLNTLSVNINTITNTINGHLASTNCGLGKPVLLDSNRIVVGENNWGVSAIAVVPFSDLDLLMQDWIGVAEQTVTAGSPCLVTLAGGITRKFGGLKPGRWYMLTNKGISMVWPDQLKSTPAQKQLILGKAVAVDRLLLSYDN